MRLFRKTLGASVVSVLLGAGLLAVFLVYGRGGGQSVVVAAGNVPQGFYTVTTAELVIPAPGNGSGNLQADVLCSSGDLATGGGHIIHPSSTTDIFVTKSYGTDSTGAFAPAAADRWRVKVLNPNALAEKRLTVHVVCADVTPPYGP